VRRIESLYTFKSFPCEDPLCGSLGSSRAAPNVKRPPCAGFVKRTPGAWFREAETGGLLCYHFADSINRQYYQTIPPSDETADLFSPSEAAQAMRLSNGKTYYLRNRKSGMYLDLQSSGVVNSTHFQQYPGHFPSELFYFNNQGGYYVIETTLVGASGKMVMDGRKNCVAGAQVVLYESVSDAPEQRWHLRRNGNGTFSISPKKNVYLNLAVSGGSYASNAKVVLADRNNEDPNQQWCLEPVDFADYDWAYVFDDANTFSYITSGYKMSDRPDHCAIDIIGKNYAVIRGQHILSPMDGSVVYVSSNKSSAGYYLVIETDCFYKGTGKKLRIGFMHMQNESFYKKDYRVEKWDHLQDVGNSGTSDGFNHLDLSVFIGGEWLKNL